MRGDMKKHAAVGVLRVDACHLRKIASSDTTSIIEKIFQNYTVEESKSKPVTTQEQWVPNCREVQGLCAAPTTTTIL